MISALAFGYGVGMAAPDATIDGVRGAVDAYGRVQPVHAGQAPVQPIYVPVQPGTMVPYGYAQPGYGMAAPSPLAMRQEPAALRRLRAGDAGASCKLHGPNHSVPPTYASNGGDSFGDPDDIDEAGRQALSRLQLPDFNVAVSRRALKYVRFLTRTHRGRDMFTSWLKRSGRYQEMVQQRLREAQLPEDLIWLAMIESGFNPRAKSPAGAMGMWQFMRSTGSVYGLEVNRFVDLRKDPVAATDAAARHLRDLHQRFGSWDLAMAAYNMGYEQLLDRIDRYNTTDFNELSRQKALPSETSNYVPKIVAAALVANNLERYGFEDVKVYRPTTWADLSVPGGTSLRTIAKAAGVSKGSLRKLNPHLLGDFVPPGVGHFQLHVPADSLSRARAALPAMVDQRMAGGSDADILAPRDLFGLSGNEDKKLRKHRWNEDENLLGLLPKPKRRSVRRMLRGRQPVAQRDKVTEQEFAPKRADREMVMYRVGAGDTLSGVARQFAIDIDDLARDNDIDPEDKLREGALLKVMVRPDVLARWKKKVERGEKTVSRKKKSKQTG